MNAIREWIAVRLLKDEAPRSVPSDVKEAPGGLQVGTTTYILTDKQMTVRAWRGRLAEAEERLADRMQMVEDARAILAYLEKEKQAAR